MLMSCSLGTEKPMLFFNHYSTHTHVHTHTLLTDTKAQAIDGKEFQNSNIIMVRMKHRINNGKYCLKQLAFYWLKTKTLMETNFYFPFGTQIILRTHLLHNQYLIFNLQISLEKFVSMADTEKKLKKSTQREEEKQQHNSLKLLETFYKRTLMRYQ